jgi:hypothetical protein
VYFHPRIIADFGVIEEIALKMLDALQGVHSTKAHSHTDAKKHLELPRTKEAICES